MFDKVEIKEKNNQLEVAVKLKSVQSVGKRKAHTHHIIALLKERNVSFGKCIKEIVLHNGADHARIGTWVFETVKLKKSPAKKPRKTKVTKKKED